uniref:V-SNARE coiled-coil homology domain-containing protein n=1 Tax=Mesocestoides corti TaxID=53468 RepID=A0A5K3FN01_MESCO
MAYNSPFGDENAQSYAYSGQNRIQQQQAEVNEVVGIMKDNVARVLERDQRLSDLDHRADELQVHSREFESISRSIQRKYFWRNMKVGNHSCHFFKTTNFNAT